MMLARCLLLWRRQIQRFGVAMGLSGWRYSPDLEYSTGILAIGAYEYSYLTAKQAGRVYLFQYGEIYDDFDNVTMQWLPKQVLQPDNSVDNDFFGKRIAVSGDASVILIGAQQAEGVSGQPSNAGVAFLYVNPAGSRWPGASWRQVARMQADDKQAGDLFGAAVAVNVDASIAMVGSFRADDPFYDEVQCGRISAGCENTGASYGLTGKCPDFEVPHSNRDGSSVYRRECFATIEQQCIAVCDPGWRGTTTSIEANAIVPSQRRMQYIQYAVTCNNHGVFHAEWDGAIECLEVPCPINTYPNPAKTNCTCDAGFSGQIWWEPRAEVWNGTCIAFPCRPRYVAFSDRAPGNAFGPCRGGTNDPCYFTCDPGYKCSSATGECFWYASAVRCRADGAFEPGGCVPVSCPQFSVPVDPANPGKGCECIDNYEGEIRWERVTESWRGVCEGEWVVAERARARLFEVVGVLLILTTVVFSAFCGAKRYRAHRKAKRIAAAQQKYVDDAKTAELDRIKEHHELRAKEEKRLNRERANLKNMSAEDAQQWWIKVTAREEAQKAAHKKAKGKWQTAVYKQLWRLGKVAEGGKPNKVMYTWQGEVGKARGNGALAECKLRYGSAWATMTKEEKQLILYRFDKDYVRPTSTNGWVKPEAVAAGGTVVAADTFPNGQVNDDVQGESAYTHGGEQHPLQLTDANDKMPAV